MTPIISSAAAEPLRGARVLLTGASGFIGGHIAQQGVAAGVDVVALGRRAGPAGTRFHPGDLADVAAIETAVRDIAPDLILHLASPGVTFGTAGFTTILDSLVTGGAALLRGAAGLAGVPHVLQAGTGLEYADQDRPIREDDPIVPSASAYGAAKAAASALLGGFAGAVPITLIRPFNIYGAGDTAPRLGNALIDKALAGAAIDVSPARQLRDFLHVDDLGRLFWHLASQSALPGQFAVFNAGSGQPRPLQDYIAAIVESLAATGVAAQVNYGALPYRPGEPMMAVPDLARLHQAVSWRPQMEFQPGIDNFVRWRLAQ